MRQIFRSLIAAFIVVGCFANGCANNSSDVGGYATGGWGGGGGATIVYGGASGWTKGDGNRDWVGGRELGGAGGATGGTGGTSLAPPATECHYASEQTPLDMLAPRGALESATYLRRLSDEKEHLPPPGTVDIDAIRAYYKVELPVDPNHPGEPRLALDVMPGEGGNRYVLQVVVQSPPAPKVRPATALAVVLDTSLSMAPSFPRAQAAVKALAKKLDRPGDVLWVITSSGQVLPITSLGDTAAVEAQLDAVSIDGGEDVQGAVKDAYTTLGDLGGWVVLVTDGAVKATTLPLQAIVSASLASSPVRLVGVGVGPAATYNADLVRTAATNGDGTSLYLDSEEHADSLLGDRFAEILQTWASHVTVKVSFPHNVRLFTDIAPSGDADGGPDDTSGGKGFIPQGGVGFGHTIVLRRVIESCLTPDELKLQMFGVSVSWIDAGGAIHASQAPIAGPLDSNYHATNDSPRLAKLAILDAYAQALIDLRPPLLTAAIDLIDANTKLGLIASDDADMAEVRRLLVLDGEIAVAQAANSQ